MERIDAALVRYLTDAIWQPILILIAAGVADLLVRRAGPHYRYILWVAALLLCVVTPAIPAKFPAVLKGAAVISVDVQRAIGGGSARRAAGWISAAYCFHVFYLWFRLWANLRNVRQLRNTAEPFAQGVSVSDSVSTPVTFGVRHPFIVLPRQFADTANKETLDAVIAHEQGHWQRNDYAWNVALLIVTAPVRFHPAVRAAYRQMAAMRELATDELASATTPGYALRLVDAARLLTQRPDANAVVGLGLFDCDRLEERVMKLTNPKPVLPTWAARILTAAMSVALTVGAVYMTNYTAFAQQAEKVGPNVTAPKLIYKVEPSYEPSAKEDKIEGPVTLTLIVTKEGIADQIVVKKSLDPRLDEKAIEAVKQWRFKPGQKNGEDVNVMASIQINFRLL